MCPRNVILLFATVFLPVNSCVCWVWAFVTKDRRLIGMVRRVFVVPARVVRCQAWNEESDLLCKT